MTNVIQVDFTSKTIDVEQLNKSKRVLKAGLIAPATEDTSYEVAGEHTSEPIKSLDDITAISNWFISKKRFRDNMLFIVGINFGLRVSDLLTLRFSHLIDDNCCFKTTFPILEKKTKNTRRVKKNRYVTINNAVVDAVSLFLENTPNVRLSDYMFRSNSGNGCNVNRPMHRNSVERIIKEVCCEICPSVHAATHTLRKTWCYHQMVMSGNDPRKLLLLQKALGHATSAQTLDYIGITAEEIREAYLQLNLGADSHYLVDSDVVESDVCVG